MKAKASVNVHLVLIQNNQFLLSLRQNTGFNDNLWGLVAGHQETGESALQAMVREAKEEINIDIQEKDLQVVHVMHRKTERENIDLFMRCTQWQGVIKNNEPEKCGGLQFYDIDTLPSTLIDYIKAFLLAENSSGMYSEFGWEPPCNVLTTPITAANAAHK